MKPFLRMSSGATPAANALLAASTAAALSHARMASFAAW